MKKSTSPNLLEIKDDISWKVVDGSYSDMRFINDPRNTGKLANVEYYRCGAIKSIRDIYEGEEFLVEYGEDYLEKVRIGMTDSTFFYLSRG